MRSVNPPDDPAYARFRFDAAREVTGVRTMLITSGQIGDPRADLATQITGALDAVEAVLSAGGYRLDDIVRLGIYTTDVDAFISNWNVVQARFEPGAVPPNTLLPVVRLVSPSALVEIEATAAR